MSDPGLALPDAPVAQPQSNALGAAPNPIPGAAPSDPTVGLMDHMSAVHNRSVNMYQKLKEAQGKAASIRQELDQLVKKGDLVTQEDVTKGATKLVAAGMSAGELAGLLADMPPDGEALQGWLVQHDLALRANEAKLNQQAGITRHDLGVGALRLVAAHSMMNPLPPGGPGGLPPEAQPVGNAAEAQAPGNTAGPVNELMGGLNG